MFVRALWVVESRRFRTRLWVPCGSYPTRGLALLNARRSLLSRGCGLEFRVACYVPSAVVVEVVL